MLSRTNIEDQLRKVRNKATTSEDVLKEVYAILAEDNKREDAIIARMKSPQKPTPRNQFDIDLLDADRIYHVDQIRKICVDYRLRFLDTKYFKNEIPQEALNEIKQLEKDHQMTMSGFKIVAPSKLFKLEDKDDPLLFAPIGNGYFYLIHKWGNDLNPFRKAWAWCVKSFENLILTTLVVSGLLAYMIPNGLFSNDTTSVEYLLIFFFTFKSVASIVLYYSFATGKNFNVAIWNSKYFNA
ncbi:hypothetical protein JCM19294_2048 [Nonlabens tegetincola]|uniref:Uncharacterized protein n=1 Tax=Nonlabens tegetincola TaxID=323273 RepID=A0A090Q0K4_9FLAO|nr:MULTISPECIES: hypothetical protein [Nonlabens]MEE2800642.1 hypothetical protein [Bacteroidota bacterium]ALM21745.1 membrane protein [Nonlabens sp. MIC269]ARN71523.1 hypothetical protein BST91_07665 [Nonlabens tegetincola]PQJ14027.1 hypothetical protein BST93_12280 [Nonlabens tegetincola]GAK96535.1 hypothetical protein JCM19294_2048 [Nonlabens tegetincola]